MRGKITSPTEDSTVKSPIPVQGIILDPTPRTHFWLAIREGEDGLIWPKEPSLTVGSTGDFEAIINEGGLSSGTKQLVLLAAPNKTNTVFLQWVKKCVSKGAWPGLSLPGYEAIVLDAVPLRPESAVPAPPEERRTIFIVHGHDDARLYEVANHLREYVTSHKPVILRELPNGGRNILEKFEQSAATAEVAVVLLTADDEGRRSVDGGGGRGPKNELQLMPRGRQNVVFELGFFFGKLGRDRVVVLRDPAVEDPSDIAGLVYEPLSGDWKSRLLKELKFAGVTIDEQRYFG